MSLQYDREELYQKVWEKPLLRWQSSMVYPPWLWERCAVNFGPVPGGDTGQSWLTDNRVPLNRTCRNSTKCRSFIASERAQLKQSAHDQNNPDLVAVDQLLSSGALNISLEGNIKPNVLIRQTASLLRSRSRKDEHGILLLENPAG